ncbi:MAG: DUF2950 family protein [Candidatus Binataceae bacterium]|jgi:hypothetical protein
MRVLYNHLVLCLSFAIGLAALNCTPVAHAAAEPGQKVFATPDDAGAAMYTALSQKDRPALLAIFGKESKGLLVSGDPVEDADDIKTFLSAYQQMHRYRVGPDGKLYLLVGAENWPMPIPLVKGPSGWYFDTAYGKNEFLYRRIGDNENAAIEILHAIAAAEDKYYGTSAGGSKEYAAKLISDPGEHDGLAWNDGGKPAGPLADLAAIALAQGYRAPAPGKSIPVHGYYFRILDSQGGHAAGGSKNYIVDGKMTNGFAVLAYPAKYRSSGVMTFITGPDGEVYESDLGPATARIAPAITSYNPDSAWSPAD